MLISVLAEFGISKLIALRLKGKSEKYNTNSSINEPKVFS